MKLCFSIDEAIYGVKGGKCVGCGKETEKLEYEIWTIVRQSLEQPAPTP